MIITSAEFIISAVKPSQYPPADPPEIAFAGRSNVGKSSLINKLLNRRRLVKTSSTPGRTQLINFFAMDAGTVTVRRLYLDHVRENVCAGDEERYEWMMAWMAQAVQHPAERPGTAVVLRGEQAVIARPSEKVEEILG